MTKSHDDKTNWDIIPPWEWGPGAIVDWKNNTLYGASGTIYRNIEVNKADLEKLIKQMRN